jgi:hypothetical protein
VEYSVVHCATPELSATAEQVPIVVPFEVKSTVPLGVPDPGGSTKTVAE